MENRWRSLFDFQAWSSNYWPLLKKNVTSKQKNGIEFESMAGEGGPLNFMSFWAVGAAVSPKCARNALKRNHMVATPQ